MKAITICQPYASAFFMAESRRKRPENRDWPTAYRGPLLIHAGKSRAWMDDFDNPMFDSLREIEMPFGCIIGMVELAACLSIDAYCERFGDDPWAIGPWCHVYEHPELFREPIPYRGALGIFEVPESVLSGHI